MNAKGYSIHIVQVIVLAALFLWLGFLLGLNTKQIKCRSLQIIDCGHIVHNGDTVRFTSY